MTNIENKIQYKFKSRELIEEAVTHKSYRNENQLEIDNERLEFLGDSVLSTVLSQLLMESFPTTSEGLLTKMRAHLVNEQSLANVALELGLESEIRFGKGELSSGGANKPRLLASVFESLMGAVFLDGGFEAVSRVIRTCFEPILRDDDLNRGYAEDYKTRLQEITQREFGELPIYRLNTSEGPDHDRTFFVDLILRDKVLSTGAGKSKKRAEQNAAKTVVEKLEETVSGIL
jgi:ribonuclease-3